MNAPEQTPAQQPIGDFAQSAPRDLGLITVGGHGRPDGDATSRTHR